MKRIFLFVIACMFASLSQAQTAVNFIADDCSGNPHNLFSELDSGKVIILVWVMPCGGCVGAAQTAANIAEDFAAIDSGRVFCYIADDFGDASCLTINSWVTNNNIARVTTFSDSVISMAPYGANGMPKVIVFGGGTSHGIYFMEDNQFADDSLGIRMAVDSALADANGIDVLLIEPFPTTLYPNPAVGNVELNFLASGNETITIEIMNVNGQAVQSVQKNASFGPNTFTLDVSTLAAGAYVVRINSSRGSEQLTLNVAGRSQ